MNTKIIKWMAAGIISSLIILLSGYRLVRASPTVDSIDSGLTENILNATVQIKLYASLAITEQEGYASPEHHVYVMSQGLGTLVLWQGSSVIVTHNHWREMLNEAQYAQILDAGGNMLCMLGMDELNRRILYKDPGTLVILAPIGLPAASESLSNQTTLSSGQVVTVARQDPNNLAQVDLLQARVVGEKDYKNQLVYKLVLLDGGMIDLGDSGGGIWLNGKLVGNMWAAYLNTIQLPLSAKTSLAAPLPSLDLQLGSEEQESTIIQSVSDIPADYMIAK